MSNNTINLRRVRKLRARAEKRAQADQNAAIHGRSKAQIASEKARIDSARAHLDAHRRARPEEPRE